ncbi:hypothetical protein NQ318_013625 [Aromia moschata]|uniref:DNA mismatch repair proteins mutS family domain-containing protein n=1 Tax=Aromia moschata TaxID=1265417 RepID=A0AAV8YJI2_9CUCU|nr:hypothetical protein NQ318_013625 [Aromia moschata]
MSKRNQGAGPSQSNTLFNYFEAPKKKARKSKRDFEMSEHKSRRKVGLNVGPRKARRVPKKPGKQRSPTSLEERSSKDVSIYMTCKNFVESPKPGPSNAPDTYLRKKLTTLSTDHESSHYLRQICSSATTTEVDAGPSASVEEMDVDGTPNKEPTEPTPQKKKVRDVVRDIHSNWPHNDLEFLKPDRIRDANKRKPDDPEYNPHTLYVPEQFLKGLTPAMRQWWELKSQHLDSVLLFKVGKFYELYHMDAVVGVLHLGFSYMKGDFAHSGFPESAYAKMTSALIDKGFKVARVEQTETPEMMAVRCKSQKSVTKFDKVVKREVCQVTTKATCVYTAQMPEARNEMPNYMYAICMKSSMTINTFLRLLALLAEYPASLILHERGAVSKKFSDMMNSYFKDIRKDALSKSQFFNASDTLEKLSMACYFRDKEGNLCWPPLFKKIADDCLPKTEYELSIRSLGACMWYLKDSKLDIQVFSAGKFEWYDPLDLTSKENKAHKEYLILDSSTIHNLSLLGGKGSLQHVLDHCETAFGKRMLQRWICRPLCDTRQGLKNVKVLLQNYGRTRIYLKVPKMFLKKCQILSDSLQRFTLTELLAEMLKAESEKAKIILDLNRRIFEKFSERLYQNLSNSSRMPKLVIQDGRHPCITNIDSFVPNDTELGVANTNYANVLILTGPNMGGKSTLMRQAAVISIMAQLRYDEVFYTKKKYFVDRVFTRLGAHDDIVQGQSTFFVELSEASSILQHATKHSLVLIDELGRGTSTHDGNAVATAYLKKLISACMVENDDDPTLESVTLLYKMAKGRCRNLTDSTQLGSAGLDRRIVVRGREIAKSLEEESRFRNVFHSIFTEKNMWNVRELLASLL